MIQEEIQQLETSALVELFELDLSQIAPQLPENEQVLRFCAVTNEKGEPVLWDGKTYTPYPIEAKGFGLPSQGSPPRPTLRAANLGGVLTELCLAYQDMCQAKLTRIRTFAKFLDDANFIDGGKSPDSSQYLPLEIYSVERKVEENEVFIEWELRWSFDLQGVLLPHRFIAQNTCTWDYKSAECGWIPVEGSYYDVSDQPCLLSNDQCAKRLKSCELRFGNKAILPYGGFPGAGMVRN